MLFIFVSSRATRMPAFWEYPPPPHDYTFYWFISDPKSKQDKVQVTNLNKLPNIYILEFCKNLYMEHTFCICVIRCINMRWIQQVLLKIQSNTIPSTDRWTDGQRWNQYTPCPTSLKWGYIKIVSDIQAVYACKVRKCGQNILGHQYSTWVIAFKYVVLLNI